MAFKISAETNIGSLFMLHKRSQLPVVLSIAGHDPSSGAGITADVKTMAAQWLLRRYVHYGAYSAIHAGRKTH